MKTVLSKYTKSRDNNFNLIRFIAASLVLYSHSFALVTGSGDAEPLRNSIGMTFGTIAVDIFFITSGFLIAGSFFGRNNIFAFVWARVLRIFPALIAAVAFCTFAIGLFFTTESASEYLANKETYRYFLKNITLFFGVEYNLPGVFENTPHKYAVNGSIWTLPYEVEMYAYLAIIGSILLYFQKWFNSNYLKSIFLCIAIIAVSANIVNHFQPFIDDKLIRLFSLFFTGSAFYIWRDNIYLSLKIFLLLVILLSISIVEKEVFLIVYSISIAYLIFYIAYVPAGIIRNFNKVGDYSYGIYIYAYPVQQSIAALIPDVSIPMMIVLSFFITFILSFLSWHLIEKKALKMKNHYVVFEKLFQTKQLAKKS